MQLDPSLQCYDGMLMFHFEQLVRCGDAAESSSSTPTRNTKQETELRPECKGASTFCHTLLPGLRSSALRVGLSLANNRRKQIG